MLCCCCLGNRMKNPADDGDGNDTTGNPQNKRSADLNNSIIEATKNKKTGRSSKSMLSRRSSAAALTKIGSYRISQFLEISLLQGSVVDFGAGEDFDSNPHPAAIVNAANTGCLGGGGVDGAISNAGGIRLENARKALPIVQTKTNNDNPDDDEDDGNMLGVRCPVGKAVLTGPNVYGSLQVPYVIHAVGPNYFHYCEEDTPKGHPLLRSAYQSSLDLAFQNNIQSIGFALLSAGLFKGPYLTLKDVLGIGLDGLQSWKPPTQKLGSEEMDSLTYPNVYLCAFTDDEVNYLERLCNDRFEKIE